MSTETWSGRAVADLMEIGRNDARTAARIQRAVELFASGREGDIKKLGRVDQSRLRVGDWRVILQIDDAADALHVVRIFNRRDAYT